MCQLWHVARLRFKECYNRETYGCHFNARIICKIDNLHINLKREKSEFIVEVDILR